MRLAEKLTLTIINQSDDIAYCAQYAEPGYATDKGLFLANWNGQERLADILEKLGYGVEWLDEWTTCGGCGGALRTQPTSYHWQQSFVWVDNEPLCVACARRDFQCVLEAYENAPQASLPPGLAPDLAEAGYTCLVDGLENGVHPGQTDKPDAILPLYEADYDSLIFVTDNMSQFYETFSLWGKKTPKDTGETV